jgi:hypothetical protein
MRERENEKKGEKDRVEEKTGVNLFALPLLFPSSLLKRRGTPNRKNQLRMHRNKKAKNRT